MSVLEWRLLAAFFGGCSCTTALGFAAICPNVPVAAGGFAVFAVVGVLLSVYAVTRFRD